MMLMYIIKYNEYKACTGNGWKWQLHNSTIPVLPANPVEDHTKESVAMD
jgi:hypothetical protein